RALQSFPVLGVTTNITLLIRAIVHPDIRSGEYDTGVIARHPELTAPPESNHLNGAAAEISERIWRSAGPIGGSNMSGQLSAGPQATQGPWRGISKSTFP
ncbi:MAG: acetyl-CoA carboxylase biotin carboxylase subunit, partial [Chloroflexota bacterium]|nr:acetyl-CoA carboxylase biotin carboxylase subunit [Chloroflexota bacterium]